MVSKECKTNICVDKLCIACTTDVTEKITYETGNFCENEICKERKCTKEGKNNSCKDDDPTKFCVKTPSILEFV